MKTISVLECTQVGGGVFPVWGSWVGYALAELREHPEASLLGPVLGSIYLSRQH